MEAGSNPVVVLFQPSSVHDVIVSCLFSSQATFDRDSVVVLFASLASLLFLITSVLELSIFWTRSVLLITLDLLPGSKIVNFEISRVTYLGQFKFRCSLLYLYIS